MDLTGSTPQPAQGTIRILTPERRISTFDAGVTTQGIEKIEIAVERDYRSGVSALDVGGGALQGSGDPLKGLNVSRAGKVDQGISSGSDTGDSGATLRTRLVVSNIGSSGEDGVRGIGSSGEDGVRAFHDVQMNIVRNIRAATSEERKNLIDELRVNRKTFQTEIVSMNLKIRDNAKELRDNFRERVKTVIGHVDHGKTARIAVAHGKGLRMLNRFRSAMARFDHILGRLESRVEKLVERDFPVDSFFDVQTSIEEAKDMSVENEIKMQELKVKYELLLLGEDPQGVSEKARAIAKELKTEIENLHAKLRGIVDDIKQATKDYNTTRSNTK